MTRENLLNKLHEAFSEDTNIKAKPYDAGKAYGGWLELIIGQVNCSEMESIAMFLRKRFSQPDRYSHNLPKLVAKREGVCLIFQDTEVERVFGNSN